MATLQARRYATCMHESSLARRIVEAALSHAHDAGAQKVLAVHGHLAEAERLAPESLEWHFRAHARGTHAEDATLHLSVHHIEARCRNCQTHYPADHHLLLCPGCNSTDGDLLEPPSIRIDRIEIA